MSLSSSEQLATEINALEQAMSDPAVMRNAAKMKELANLHSEKREQLSIVESLEKLADQRRESEELLTADAADMRRLAEEEIREIQQQEEQLRTQLEERQIARDPRDARNVIIEIRAGAGGEEAALFAAELFRSYGRYAEIKGWKMHTLGTSDSEQGGFKEVVAEVTAPLRQGSAGQISGPFGTLKFERGVHRVQRVPATEKMGRTHTSTVTVAILPIAEEVDLEIRKEDLRIDTYRSGGAGGQHVNKTSSAVRITHLPTNTVVAVQDERSQHKNKDKAMSILRSKLLEAQEEARAKAEASERRTQVGTGDRSEKIRTYNFPQDRVTDHRIKQSWSNIPAIMNGDWDRIFTDLQRAARELALSHKKK